MILFFIGNDIIISILTEYRLDNHSKHYAPRYIFLQSVGLNFEYVSDSLSFKMRTRSEPFRRMTQRHLCFAGKIFNNHFLTRTQHTGASLCSCTHTASRATQSNAPTRREKNDKKAHTNTDFNPRHQYQHKIMPYLRPRIFPK